MKKFVPKTDIGKQLYENKRYRIIFFAVCGLSINLIYAFYNGVLGIRFHSIWFISLCAYYVILSTMRFGAVMCGRLSAVQNSGTEIFVMRFCGALLIVLAVILSGSVYISLKKDIAVRHREILMITIASYTFYKITLSIVNIIKIKKENSPLLSTIRNIGCADAAASVLSLQRSMLVSFEGKNDGEIYIMNVLTGAAVILFIVILGVGMILKKSEGNS